MTHLCNMVNNYIPIDSVLASIKDVKGKPFTLTYYSMSSKVRKTKNFLYRSVIDIPGEGTITLTDPTNPSAPMSIKIGLMIIFNNQPIKH